MRPKATTLPTVSCLTKPCVQVLPLTTSSPNWAKTDPSNRDVKNAVLAMAFLFVANCNDGCTPVQI
ncbi:hypothetical protein [Moraxella lacunata]|uniref:hypothetical protein n=1 Tax=Moraxella lacunata TaxID=477 RepID=UPI003EE2F97A